MNIAALEQWIGKSEVRRDHVTLPMVERMAATFDRDEPPPEDLSCSIGGASPTPGMYHDGANRHSPHRRLVAIRAPSAKVASLAHTTLSATMSVPAKVPKPQSTDAMTRVLSPTASTT